MPSKRPKPPENRIDWTPAGGDDGISQFKAAARVGAWEFWAAVGETYGVQLLIMGRDNVDAELEHIFAALERADLSADLGIHRWVDEDYPYAGECELSPTGFCSFHPNSVAGRAAYLGVIEQMKEDVEIDEAVFNVLRAIVKSGAVEPA